ncbi:MAG TPA: glutamate formimidoyltransferase, partial [Bacteroidota bacterium]|nr:glutamate formimidoyltransferase [Bacteroidota bacterium]
MKIVECVPNFSEGRRSEVIEAILNAAKLIRGVTVLDCESDANHNRMVLTFVGPPEAVKEAALSSSAKAIELIDLTKHTGEHPRMGAVDVVPFVPLREVSMDECVRLARDFAQEFSIKFSVPVFLYENAATREDRKNLADVRHGQFEGLRDLIGKDPSKKPDFGPEKIHPTAGATAVGARPILIAYNVNLASEEVLIAKKIAKRIRERDGGLPSVKALGFELKNRQLVQVSMNLTDYTKTSMHTAFDAISEYAKEYGVGVVESEIVGLVPQEALSLASFHYLSV